MMINLILIPLAILSLDKAYLSNKLDSELRPKFK